MVEFTPTTLRFLLTAVWLLTTSGISFGQEMPLRIDSCYAMAYRNYPLTKQSQLFEATRDYTISNASKAYLPQVNLTVLGGYISDVPSFGPEGETSGSDHFKLIGTGQLRQVLWDGGVTSVQKDIVRAHADVEKSNVEVSTYAIRERINQLFFGTLVIDEQLKQLRIVREDLRLREKKVRLSMENGIALQTDVDEIRAELLNLDQREIEFQYTRKGYVKVLALWIGKALPENAELQIPEAVTVSEQIERPELSMFDAQLSLIQAESAIQKANNMPKIGLMGYGLTVQPGMPLGNSSLSWLFVGGLTVSWNTSGIYKSSNNRELQRLQSELVMASRETFLFNTRLQDRQVSTEIEKQQALVAKDEEIVNLRESITSAYELKYDNGLCSMSDVLEAMNRETESRTDLALHRVQLSHAIYKLKVINGN